MRNLSNLETQCERVLDHRITFASFMRATKTEFTRMAKHLLRRWVPPTWMTPEDLVQELYLGAWIMFFGPTPFDPSRGVKLSKYIAWNAMGHAKRALHKARGAQLHGSADCNPSNIEKPFTAFDRDDREGESFVDLLVADEPNAEQVMIVAETRSEAIERAMRSCNTARERVAIIALDQGGSVDGAGRVLYDDFDTRIALRLGSEEHATRYVTRAASAVADRLGPQSAS